MKAFKTIEAEKDYSTDNVKDMIQNQRSEYIKEITNLQSKFDETKQRLTSQVESLTEKNNSLDLEYRIKLSELETQNGQLSQQIEELLAIKCQNEEAIRVQETEKLELIKSLERQYKEKIKRLETDLNDRAAKHQQALEDIEDEKSRHFMQMKDFYETEKLRIEARIQEERKNYKLKFEQLQEDHEEQLKEEQEAHEDEVEMLRDEIKQLEYRCQETIQEAEQNHAMNMQKIEYLEQSLKETKESLANYQKESTIALNTHLHSYRSKEQLYNDKEKDMERKNIKLEIENGELKSRIEALFNEIDQLKETNKDLKEDIMNNKIDFTRKEANLRESLIQQYEDKTNKLRYDLLEDYNTKVSRLETENARLSQKYESKLDDIKDLEDRLSKLKFEKSQEASEIQRELEEELDLLETENNELRNKLQDAEREISEISSNYDRDKALWDEKFAFLDNQKNQAKKDLQDAHRKFEMTVEQLQRKDSSERGKTENAQMLLISSIEKKYKDQIKDMNDAWNQREQELLLKHRSLEKDHRELKEKYEIEVRCKYSEFNSLEKKLREMTENEHKYIEEIKILKNERDKK
mmetsp:Transcript_39024/g.44627  ORF Transcript_39024/g.44627 Transcript_39024/m.44627 type:complete len:579 (+) Transcript_39024:502-2238(+)